MRAVQVTRHGEPADVLAVNEIDVPVPAAGEVLIKVSAAALNFNDILRARGGLVSVAQEPPFTLGMDLTGVVEAAGEGAEQWVDQRVVAVAKDALGGIAEYAVAPASGVFPAPPSLSEEEAAAFLLPFHTSYLALVTRGALQAGETVLVISGASGLGTAAIQIAKALGARVIATAGSAEKLELCRTLGADVLIDHSTEDFAEATLQATGDLGADVVCDLAGGDFVGKSWTCVARGGRYLSVGFTDDTENGMTGRPLRMVSIGNFSVVGVLSAYVDHLDPLMRRFGFNPFTRVEGEQVHAALSDLVANGKVRPHVGRVVDMEQAGAALAAHQARTSIGRTVVRIG